MLFAVALAALTAIQLPLPAQTTNPPGATNTVTRLPEVLVEGEAERAHSVQRPFPPAVQGTRINVGKKVSVADLDQQPADVNNDYRRAFSELPGLVVSEMAVPSHLNIGYRGIGDPHESEFILTLKDGVPIGSDLFGYPTTYYTPPLQGVRSVELIRGGSSLLYGPQPGPKLNFITYDPPKDRPFTISTEQSMGSHGLYSTYSQFGGTLGDFGYLGGFHHRQADGFRANADYRVFNGDLKLTLQAGERSRWSFGFYGYDSESGEAGRLTLAQYQANREQTTRPIDRVWIKRYVPSLTLEHEVSDQTLLVARGWAGYQDRFSRRQNGAGTLTDLDQQEFHFLGTDVRARHFWSAWAGEHALTAGFTLYGANSPRSRERNPVVSEATSGPLQFDLDRHTLYGSLFAENKFQYGRFSIVPAVRLEFINLGVEENFNLGKTLRNENFSRVVPLGALGLNYDLGRGHDLYANVSQGYRPPKYDDLVNPTRGPASQGGAPDEGDVLNYEFGLRGAPTSWLQYDSSLFFVDWDGFVETQIIGADEIRSNSGRAEYYGWETSAEVDVVSLYDDVRGTEYADQWGRLSVFGSFSLLEAEFASGLQNGNTPSYAPDYTIKAGVQYRWKDRVKLALTGVWVDDHFWQDSNLPGAPGIASIPAYTVWDLTAEARLYRDHFAVVAGINNLFNEDYFSRVRGDGIEVVDGRNYFAGFKLSF
jgi:Fe(3+) dicitrate transport protein